MDIRWKKWNNKGTSWIPAWFILGVMGVILITWGNVKPSLLEDAESLEKYYKSAYFKEEFEKCMDKAVELGLSGKNVDQWKETLNTKVNLIYYVANEARNEIYHNIDKYNTNEPLYIELAEEPTVKSYYLKHFFSQVGYRATTDDTKYFNEYEDQGIKLGTKDVEVYLGVRKALVPGDVFYTNYQRFMTDRQQFVRGMEVSVWVIVIVLLISIGGVMYKQLRNKQFLFKMGYIPLDLAGLIIGGSLLVDLPSISMILLGEAFSINLMLGILTVIIVDVVYQLKHKQVISRMLAYQAICYGMQTGHLAWTMLIGSLVYLGIDGLVLWGLVGDGIYFNPYVALSILVLWNGAGLVFLWQLGTSLQIMIKAATSIAEGDIQHQIDVNKRGFLLKEFGEQLNLMGIGLDKAVNNALKSEMMKAELITNVSHDLKTPLTSIINYIGLLKKEAVLQEPAKSYVEVLDEKSKRLKVLIEDLVEVSKATTGNVKVELETLDLVQFMDQAIGEYKDRLAGIPIEIKFNYPSQPVWVLADGKHLWRIVENLLTNVIKYAMPASRLYIDVIEKEGRSLFIFKNMSKAELGIAPEVLTGRFVRGDQARTTEGSGLGLAIAKSLVEVQQGSLAIEIDGDLFKVSVELVASFENENKSCEMDSLPLQ